MAARIQARIRSQAESLKRLAVVFAVELRLKIVTELYERAMSPKQFHAEFGGGSLSRVSQNFECLEEHNWLRPTETKGPGGNRRGGVEHFYRATELAYFDQATWAALPYSIRVAFSWNIFGQIAARLREAIEAEALDVPPSFGFSTEKLRLDKLGRERAIAAVTKTFESLYEEQHDAGKRVYQTGEDLVRANVVQLAFDSPTSGIKEATSKLAVAVEPVTPLLLRAARIFVDELCMEIIEAANERAISAREFHAEFGGNIGKIRQRFRKAADNGWLEEVEWKSGGRRRGATEKFYRATIPASAKAEKLLADVPPSVASTKNWQSFERLHRFFLDAMKAETVDAHTDRCLAWSMLKLDQVGWENVVAELRELWTLLREEAKLAKTRMSETGERPMSLTFALASFTSSPEIDRQP